MTNTNQINTESIELHKKFRGKFEIKSLMPVGNNEELARAYTPGVAAVCNAIYSRDLKAKDVVSSKNTVAIITDGSAVLGLGNIGSVAGLPVMEGKAVLLKEFAGVDAFPIALSTQDTDEIIQTIKNIAPTFGAINLEDISAPRCFDIEKRLIDELDIPVFHDDQHGTAIVALAGLINALKVVGKTKDNIKVVVNGAGAAGHAISELLSAYGFKVLTVLDSKGVLNESKVCGTGNKEHFCEVIKETCANGDSDRCDATSLSEALVGVDVFIGVSAPDILTKEMVSTMADYPIVFALANPQPEILPSDAKAGGAAVVATGRSDFDNQINNALVFPGLFKGLLSSGATNVTTEMKVSIAEALANLVKDPTPEKIIPSMFDYGVVDSVAGAVSYI
jgi:malate dehydrogenase (oxaloacetate-decarboxylating)